METDAIAKPRNRSNDKVTTDCPLTAALRVIGGKWSLIVLYWLDDGPKRFNELHKLMPAISHKVLAATLRDVEKEGLMKQKHRQRGRVVDSPVFRWGCTTDLNRSSVRLSNA